MLLSLLTYQPRLQTQKIQIQQINTEQLMGQIDLT